VEITTVDAAAQANSAANIRLHDVARKNKLAKSASSTSVQSGSDPLKRPDWSIGSGENADNDAASSRPGKS
jgi:hypothetical protein